MGVLFPRNRGSLGKELSSDRGAIRFTGPSQRGTSSRRTVKIYAIIVACLVSACTAPPRPTPYVVSDCPLPAGTHGYPIAAHDPAGRLDTATLRRIARSIGEDLAISRYHGESVPDDLAARGAFLARNQPLQRRAWNPSETDTASMLIVYRAGTPSPFFRLAGAESGDFARRVLRAANAARDRAQRGKPQSDTLPLQLQLADGDSMVVLLRFGSEPGPGDGVAHFAAQERDVWPLGSNQAPRYPTNLKSMDGEVVVAFIVGADSAADMNSVSVLRASNAYFAQSVLEALPHHRFVPLQLDCRVVPIQVQQPFVFRGANPQM